MQAKATAPWARHAVMSACPCRIPHAAVSSLQGTWHVVATTRRRAPQPACSRGGNAAGGSSGSSGGGGGAEEAPPAGGPTDATSSSVSGGSDAAAAATPTPWQEQPTPAAAAAASTNPMAEVAAAPLHDGQGDISRSTSATSSTSSSVGVDGRSNAPKHGSSSGSDSAREQRRLERCKVQLLAALSSLDRGLAANAREAADVDAMASQLEALVGPVSLGRASPSLELLPGTWRLVYSSGFNTGSLGGRRPGPPAAGFPAVLGQVYQRIDPATMKLDNIVELLFSYGFELPSLSTLTSLLPGKPSERRRSSAAAGGAAGRESPGVRLTLRHDYELSGANGVKIVFEETFGQFIGSSLLSSLPRLMAPNLPEPLKPPRAFRSAVFEVTVLDATMRITRGDRGELRIYLRDSDDVLGPGEGVRGGVYASSLASLGSDDD